ncbi:hypothetical protein QBC39DRAFT_58444 [Podospora conica]|nr:hypothetical protein QBC39DRAFT_58444 [Schizothecium conicum]
MSFAHRRTNSTDPRPGGTSFPRTSIRPSEKPSHTRGGSPESHRPPPRPPRPESTAFPRMTMRPVAERSHTRMGSENTGFPRMTMRPAAERSHLRMGSGDARPPRRPSQAAPAAPRPALPRDDAATKTQMNQTLAIAMMASPVNPLPFFIPIPLGVTMLVGPSNDRRGSTK